MTIETSVASISHCVIDRGWHQRLAGVPSQTRSSIIGKKSLSTAQKKAQKMGLDRVERTIWMCVDRGVAKCAAKDVMSQSWKHLHKRLKAAGKEDSLRTFAGKIQCMGICRGGPILCVMPDNVWYGHCVPGVIDEIVDRHLIGGEVVQQYVISRPK